MDLDWVLEHFDRSDGFPRPDWSAISERIAEGVPEKDRRDAMTAAARNWLRATAGHLGAEHRIEESRNFLLLARLSPRAVANLLAFLERARRRILVELLPGVASAWDGGKQAALVLEDVERYVSYIAYFYPDGGEYAASGGICVGHDSSERGRGYPHFVALGRDPVLIETVLSHELTHDCLRHLGLPSWLDEGLATTVEAILMEAGPLVVSADDLANHRLAWEGAGIQEFWAGMAVHRPDDHARLSYELARMAVRSLSRDFARFREFVLLTDREDAGDAAARQVFGIGLGELVGRFLGPGDWSPRPDTWSRSEDDPDSAAPPHRIRARPRPTH